MARLRDTWPYTWRDAGLFVAAYVVLTAGFVAIGWPLRDDDDHAVQRLDERVSQWMVDHRGPTVNDLTWVGSTLADTFVKIAITSVVVIVMLRVWHRWFEAAYVAIALILEASVFITVTTIVGRSRPDVPKLGESSVDSSFPSGHVAAAVVYGAMAVVVFWRTTRAGPRIAATVAAVAVPIAVGFSRVHRGFHYLSDVIAGAALGVLVLLITTKIARDAQRRHEGRDDERVSPAATTPMPRGTATDRDIG